MRKKYKAFLWVIIIEMLLLYVLNKFEVKVQSWVGNAVGTLIFLLPILGLFFTLGRDEKITPRKRMCCKVAFWFLILCYVSGGIATFLESFV